MQKTLIVLVVGLMASGCGKDKQPVRKLTAAEEKVAGEYEYRNTYKVVLLENGIGEGYLYGKKKQEYKWGIVNGDIHAVHYSGSIYVYRIDPDGSITEIAEIDRDEKRIDTPKEDQVTLKKVK